MENYSVKIARGEFVKLMDYALQGKTIKQEILGPGQWNIKKSLCGALMVLHFEESTIMKIEFLLDDYTLIVEE